MYQHSPFSHSPHSSHSSRPLSRHRIQHSFWLVAGIICLLGALALAGCGVTTTATGVGGGGPTQPPMAGSGGNGGIATSVNPCLGAAGAPAKPPTLVLTANDSHKVTQAHPGDVIEVQLSSKMHWTAPNIGASAVLTQLQSQGGIDSATQSCHWLYAVKAAGTAKLDFTGVIACESNSPCPMIAEAEEFTIQVS